MLFLYLKYMPEYSVFIDILQRFKEYPKPDGAFKCCWKHVYRFENGLMYSAVLYL